MIKLGIFRSRKNNSYTGHYYPESKKVEAVRPLKHMGSATAAFEIEANSEEEARKKIEDAIETIKELSTGKLMDGKSN